MSVFLDMTPRVLVYTYQCFRGANCIKF